MNEHAPRAKFRSMDQGTAEDWATIGSHFFPFAQGLSDRVLTHLRLLDGDYGGFPVDRLEHSLQTATRAHRGGESEEYVVMALAPRHRRHARDAQSSRHRRRDREAVRRREAPLDVRASRHLPGLLLLPLSRAGPRHAGAVPRPSTFRGYRSLLRALRSDGVRRGLRYGVARFLRTDSSATSRHRSTRSTLLPPNKDPLMTLLRRPLLRPPSCLPQAAQSAKPIPPPTRARAGRRRRSRRYSTRPTPRPIRQAYARPLEARVYHVALDLGVDFEAKGSAAPPRSISIASPMPRESLLDDKGLEIASITDGSDQPLITRLAAPTRRWARLWSSPPPDTRRLVIKYKSAKDAGALRG